MTTWPYKDPFAELEKKEWPYNRTNAEDDLLQKSYFSEQKILKLFLAKKEWLYNRTNAEEDLFDQKKVIPFTRPRFWRELLSTRGKVVIRSEKIASWDLIKTRNQIERLKKMDFRKMTRGFSRGLCQPITSSIAESLNDLGLPTISSEARGSRGLGQPITSSETRVLRNLGQPITSSEASGLRGLAQPTSSSEARGSRDLRQLIISSGARGLMHLGPPTTSREARCLMNLG